MFFKELTLIRQVYQKSVFIVFKDYNSRVMRNIRIFLKMEKKDLLSIEQNITRHK